MVRVIALLDRNSLALIVRMPLGLIVTYPWASFQAVNEQHISSWVDHSIYYFMYLSRVTILLRFSLIIWTVIHRAFPTW